MRFRWRTWADKRANRDRWQLTFALLPRRLCEINAPAHPEGKRLRPSSTVVWLERVAVRTKDLDGRRPYIYGPAGWFLTQDHAQVPGRSE